MFASAHRWLQASLPTLSLLAICLAPQHLNAEAPSQNQSAEAARLQTSGTLVPIDGYEVRKFELDGASHSAIIRVPRLEGIEYHRDRNTIEAHFTAASPQAITNAIRKTNQTSEPEISESYVSYDIAITTPGRREPLAIHSAQNAGLVTPLRVSFPLDETTRHIGESISHGDYNVIFRPVVRSVRVSEGVVAGVLTTALTTAVQEHARLRFAFSDESDDIMKVVADGLLRRSLALTVDAHLVPQERIDSLLAQIQGDLHTLFVDDPTPDQTLIDMVAVVGPKGVRLNVIPDTRGGRLSKAHLINEVCSRQVSIAKVARSLATREGSERELFNHLKEHLKHDGKSDFVMGLQKIFGLDGKSKVMFEKDFESVGREHSKEWKELRSHLTSESFTDEYCSQKAVESLEGDFGFSETESKPFTLKRLDNTRAGSLFERSVRLVTGRVREDVRMEFPIPVSVNVPRGRIMMDMAKSRKGYDFLHSQFWGLSRSGSSRVDAVTIDDDVGGAVGESGLKPVTVLMLMRNSGGRLEGAELSGGELKFAESHPGRVILAGNPVQCEIPLPSHLMGRVMFAGYELIVPDPKVYRTRLDDDGPIVASVFADKVVYTVNTRHSHPVKTRGFVTFRAVVFVAR